MLKSLDFAWWFGSTVFFSSSFLPFLSSFFFSSTAIFAFSLPHPSSSQARVWGGRSNAISPHRWWGPTVAMWWQKAWGIIYLGGLHLLKTWWSVSWGRYGRRKQHGRWPCSWLRWMAEDLIKMGNRGRRIEQGIGEEWIWYWDTLHLRCLGDIQIEVFGGIKLRETW